MVQAIGLLVAGLVAIAPAWADDPVSLAVSRGAQQELWRARIQGFLDKGVLPLIDVESSLPPRLAESELADAAAAMDRLGIGIISLDGLQAPKDGSSGYRWSYRVHRAVNAYPERFALATNGGTSPSWRDQRSDERSYIAQLETAARSGQYAAFGEVEFRHYPSPRQCQMGRTDRDVSVPLDSPNGRRLFQLAEETQMLLPIHLEAEDGEYDALEKTLAAFPRAKIVVAHFTQVRFPDRARRITPERIRAMLSRFPNLYFDIATGAPGHTYPCNNDLVDVVLWKDGLFGQTDTLKPEYRSLLADFSSRFMTGLDFGARSQTMAQFLEQSSANVRRILRDLPEPAQHAIAYRNAWFMMTGKRWIEAAKK